MHLNVLALIVWVIGSFHYNLLGLQSEVDPPGYQSEVDPALIPTNIQQLCVGRNVCVNKTVTVDRHACCRECSCDVTCTDTNTCCYPSMNNESYRRYQTCEYITLESIRSSRTRASVFMVTEKPEGGCVNDSLTDCCDGVRYPWGSAFPVVSRSTGIVYKNDRYALCHGETDFRVSIPILLCDNIGQASLNDGCLLMFDSVQTATSVCFMDERSRCPVDFVVEPSLNLTKEEIRHNCEKDFVSVYGAYFKSIYCYYCQADSTVKLSSICPTTSVPLRTESFANILDTRSWTEQLYGPSPAPQPEVCDEQALSKDEQRCRPLMCPEGQIWINGCEYSSSMWSMNRLKMIVEVRLPPCLSISIQSFQQLVANMTSPWPSSNWEVLNYLYRYGQHQAELNDTTFLRLEEATDTKRNIGCFYVTLKYRRQTMRPEQFSAETREALDNNWTMTYGVDQLVLSQELSPTSFEEIEVISENNTDQMYVQKWAFSDVRQNFTVTPYELFEAIVVKDDRKLYSGSSINVTKMLFCKQIALSENEVTLFKSRKDGTGAALMVRKTGSLLYNQAFKVVKDEQNTFSCLVCMEDFYPNATTLTSEGAYINCEQPFLLVFLFAMTLILVRSILN